MKPYPLASLNHFTVPCSAILLLFPFQSIYAVRSEVLRAVQAGMQEAAQQPILIKRLFSLSEKAIFRWLNCLCRLRRKDAFGNHLSLCGHSLTRCYGLLVRSGGHPIRFAAFR